MVIVGSYNISLREEGGTGELMPEDRSQETIEVGCMAPTRFEEIYRRYRRVLLKFFHRRRIHGGDVEELVQETYLRLVTSPQGGAQLDSPAGYLFTIASNLANDWHRTRLIREALTGQMLPVQRGLDSEQVDAERINMARQEMGRVIAALDALPQLTCDIFLLNRLERVPYRTLARQYEVTVAEVRKHMGSAFMAVNEALEGRECAQEPNHSS
jgi:RNA polymerase sigma-70 factor (ECF subfamily)